MDNQEAKTQQGRFSMNKNVKKVILSYCKGFCGRSNECSCKCPLMKLKEEASKAKPKRNMSEEQMANLRKSHRTNRMTDKQFQDANKVIGG